jgi:hypothetical protein
MSTFWFQKNFSLIKKSLKTITLANLILSQKQDCIFSMKTHTSMSFCALQSPTVYLYSGKHSAKAEVGGKCLVITMDLFLKLWSNEKSSFYDINN